MLSSVLEAVGVVMYGRSRRRLQWRGEGEWWLSG